MSTALVPVADIEKMKQRIFKWSTPEALTGCWIWFGSCGNSGYGKTRFDHSHDISAHRVSYTAFNGLIPNGLCVLHSCDLRSCVNPQHLFLGTKAENSQDMVKKGRHYNPAKMRTHCPQGHDYSGLNSQGRRICKICNEQARVLYQQRKEVSNV